MMQAILIALIGGLTGGGVSQLVIFFVKRHDDKKQDILELSMAQGMIYTIGQRAIDKGEITARQLAVLEDIYQPYEARGGNHMARIIMEEVRDLPVHK